MDTVTIKSNLQKFYNGEAGLRNASKKQEWKLEQRNQFCEIVKSENKTTLLELGAGAGHDSKFFQDCGLNVIAVDLSGEMVKECTKKSIECYEMDFYTVSSLNKTFDCVWAMNSLLHVPKTDLPRVLREIDAVLNTDGLFYMGVYGGIDSENEFLNEVSDTPRFFSSYSENTLKDVLGDFFDILVFKQMDVGRNIDFQSILMRKR